MAFFSILLSPQKQAANFVLECRTQRQVSAVSLAGSLMEFGASVAGGCSIGNGLVKTEMMTWQGWLALLFMIFGAWTASYFMFIRPQIKRQKTAVKRPSP
ncbi:YeeE/YedE thiosulfate transporter family protein [Heyndrickxia faecalis]|nr:hypothetical protein P421_10045 [Heyndrickxia coagulans P38]